MIDQAVFMFVKVIHESEDMIILFKPGRIALSAEWLAGKVWLMTVPHFVFRNVAS